MQYIHLMIGNIGTGKTTTATKILEENPNTLYVSDDDICTLVNMGNYGPELWSNKYWPVYSAIKRSIAEIAIENGFSIIIDSTNMSESKRAVWVKKAKQLNVSIIAHVHLDHALGIKRRQETPRGQTFEMWQKVYERFQSEYEEVTSAEGFNEIKVI